MSWTTALWSMNVGICLILAAVYLLVWLRARDTWINMAFSLWATAVASAAVFELAMMHAQTTEQYGELMRWIHIPLLVATVSYIWFIRLYLQAGRLWLLWSIYAVNLLALVVNFVTHPNVNFSEITALRHIPIFGEMVAVPVGAVSPWEWTTRISAVLIVLFIVDAAIRAWRQGRHKKTLVMCVAVLSSSVMTITLVMMMEQGNLPMPVTVSIPSLPPILLMAYELGAELLHARHVSQELKQNQERMRLAAAAADLGLWEWDIIGNEMWASEKTRARVGLYESERMDFDRYLQSLHPDDREPTRQAVRHALQGSGEYKAEFRVVAASGVTRWISACGQVERGSKGNPLHMRGISMDITERKQTEKALKESEKRLNEAQRIAHIGSWELDLLTNTLIWSDEIFRIFEIDKERFGASYEFFLSTVHPDDREAVNAAYTQSLETRKPYAITHRLLMPDGRIKYVQEQCETFYSPDGKPLRSVGTVQDITELKKSEQALIEAEHRYRTVAEFTYDWEYWEGPNNEILYMSPSCERVTGYNKDEFIANPQLLEDVIIPEDKDIWTAHRSEIQEKSRFMEIQFRIKKKDGAVRWIEHACQPVFDEHGEFSGFRVSNRDVTVRKESKEALLRSQKSLQYLAGKLITIQEEERRRLAREMHDDLTQRLALLAIDVSKLEFENQQHDPPMSAKLQDMKKKIIKLSKDIHDISRQIHPAILDDLGLVDAIRSECAAFSQREEIHVEYETKNVPSSVPKNVAICIYRITQESLRNIVKHARTNQVYVSLIGLDGNIILTIRDNGIGFDPMDGKSQKGIGLTSMQERARLIHGEFSIQSKPGEGTVIKVIAPYTEEQE